MNLGVASASSRLPRIVHPVAWWGWALGLAAAATWTTNPLLLAVIIAVVATVVTARRSDTPWGRAFSAYLALAAVIVVVRVAFRVILIGGTGDSVLFSLPELTLPSWLTGIGLGGPVTLGSVLAGFYDGLRLGTLVVCVGAANALAHPRRLLRSVPGALYEVGTVLVVSASMAPQLADSIQRVRRARRLRGTSDSGLTGLRSLVVPVLEDAFERSLQLAAAMDSRGYGRTTAVPAAHRRATGGLVVVGVLGITVGIYALLDPTGTGDLGIPLLVAGALAAGVGLWLGGRRVRVSRYRPDPWAGPEWLVVGCSGLAVLFVVVGGLTEPSSLRPSLAPLTWPQLPPLALVGILAAGLPAVLTPPPPVQTARSRHAVAQVPR